MRYYHRCYIRRKVAFYLNCSPELTIHRIFLHKFFWLRPKHPEPEWLQFVARVAGNLTLPTNKHIRYITACVHIYRGYQPLLRRRLGTIGNAHHISPRHKCDIIAADITHAIVPIAMGRRHSVAADWVVVVISRVDRSEINQASLLGKLLHYLARSRTLRKSCWRNLPHGACNAVGNGIMG